MRCRTGPIFRKAQSWQMGWCKDPARPAGRSVLRNLDIPVAGAPAAFPFPRPCKIISGCQRAKALAAPTVTGLPVLRSRGRIPAVCANVATAPMIGASHVLSQDLAGPGPPAASVFKHVSSLRDRVRRSMPGNAVIACDCVRSRLAPM